MNKNLLLLLLPVALLTSFIPGSHKPVINRWQARKAYEFLNEVRLHPEKYFNELRFLRDLPVTKEKLVWNNALAKAAEQKAGDMASRNYFNHVDPSGYGMNYYINKAGYKLDPGLVKYKDENNFESIAASTFYLADSSDYGVFSIKDLITDELVPSKGHRNHLLGIGSWNSKLTDIGIGIAIIDSGASYNIYVSVLIAKHDKW